MSTCRLPSDSGNCDHKQIKYFYDGQVCRSFNYSGCGGNSNHFDTQSDCEAFCASTKASAVPPEVLQGRHCRLNSVISGPIGRTLQLRRCVTCECLLPPLFTCVEQTCPAPPDGDCETRFEADACCPTYICKGKSTSCARLRFFICVPFSCIAESIAANQTVVPCSTNEPAEREQCERKNGCYYSINVETGCGQCSCDRSDACPTPMCDQGCELHYPAGQCPTCRCSTQPHRSSGVLTRSVHMQTERPQTNEVEIEASGERELDLDRPAESRMSSMMDDK